MPSWCIRVDEAKDVSEQVQYVTATESICMNLPKELFSAALGEELHFMVCEDGALDRAENYKLVMRGVIIDTSNHRNIASCGGFLFQFPYSYGLHTPVLLTLRPAEKIEVSTKKRSRAKRESVSATSAARIMTRSRAGPSS